MLPHANQCGLDIIVCAGRIEIRLGDQMVNESGIVLQDDAIAAGDAPPPQIVNIAKDEGELPGEGAAECSER